MLLPPALTCASSLLPSFTLPNMNANSDSTIIDTHSSFHNDTSTELFYPTPLARSKYPSILPRDMEQAFRERFGPDPPQPAAVDPAVATERFRQACDRFGLQFKKSLSPVRQTAVVPAEPEETQRVPEPSTAPPTATKTVTPPHLRARSQPTPPEETSKASTMEERNSSIKQDYSSSPPVVRLPSSAADTLSPPSTVRISTRQPASKYTSAQVTSKAAMIHYEHNELMAIGKLCGSRLPPASAVQAMFLYEMQRETECEKLFQGQMFRLARTEASANAQHAKMLELEKQIKGATQQVHTKDVEDRLATNRVRMEVQQAKINEQSTRINEQDQRIVSLNQKMDDLGKSSPSHLEEQGCPSSISMIVCIP